MEMFLASVFIHALITIKELPHPNSYTSKRNYSLIIEDFVFKSASTSSIIKTRVLKVVVCVFLRGRGCFVVLFISKALGGMLNRI